MDKSSKKILLALTAVLTIFFLLIQQNNRRNLKKVRIAISENRSASDRAMIQSIHDALLAEKTENLIEGLKNDEEKCIKIAEWISKHISNKNASHWSDFISFSSRAGLCGSRSALFVAMLGYINIPARRFNIYNYPFAGGGHSCAQAYYNNQWHFFDPTYAGYFTKNKKILSFDEIQKEAKSGNHLQYLVVFPDTHDKTIFTGSEEFEEELDKNHANFSTILHVNNVNRMERFYRNIHRAKTFGFLKKEKKVLLIEFNRHLLKNGKWLIGGDDIGFDELETEARQLKLSQFLSKIGNCTDNFQHDWCFHNLDIKKTYSVTFTGYFEFRKNDSSEENNYGDYKFIIEGTGAEIISNREIDHDTKTLEVTFKPTQKNPTIHIYHKNEKKKTQGCFYANKIEIIEK